MLQQKSTWIRIGLVLALPLTVMAFGCTGAGKSKISGTVTYKGSALPGGSIVFRAEDGREYGSGIGKDGKYYVDNVPRGNMKVYFNIPPATFPSGAGGQPGQKAKDAEIKERMKPPSNLPPEAQKALGGAAGTPDKLPEIPAKYRSADSTPLTFDVKSGSNTYDVPLAD